MNEWIKWWKDKTFLTILGIALLTMLVAFLASYFLSWGWVIAMVAALVGGGAIRRIIVDKLDELSNK